MADDSMYNGGLLKNNLVDLAVIPLQKKGKMYVV